MGPGDESEAPSSMSRTMPGYAAMAAPMAPTGWPTGARRSRAGRPSVSRNRHCDSRRRSSAVITSTNGPPVLAMSPPKTISRGSTDWAKIWIVSPMARTTMSGGNTGGTQYRAHCVNQHSFDFCSTHVNTDFEIVHSVFRHQSSPVLHRTFRLISVYIRLLTTILTNSPKTTLTCTTRRMTY